MTSMGRVGHSRRKVPMFCSQFDAMNICVTVATRGNKPCCLKRDRRAHDCKKLTCMKQSKKAKHARAQLGTFCFWASNAFHTHSTNSTRGNPTSLAFVSSTPHPIPFHASLPHAVLFRVQGVFHTRSNSKRLDYLTCDRTDAIVKKRNQERLDICL